jgi:hypothetical protein
MRGNPPKITEAQRQEILRTYMVNGTKAASVLCVSFGLHPRYYSGLASLCGVATKKAKPLTPQQRAKIGRPTVNHNDPRWSWAIDRGPVVAP